MNLTDIFFAIGIFILSALLVFVVYDDLTGSPYQISIEEFMENNVTKEYNITQKDLKLVPTSARGDTVDIELTKMSKTVNTQSSNTATFTQELNTKNNPAQSAYSPNNKADTNSKSYSDNSKYSGYSNKPNNNNNNPMGHNMPAR